MKKFAGLAIVGLAGCCALIAPALVGAAVLGQPAPVDPGYLDRIGRWIMDASVLAQLSGVDAGYLKDFLIISIAGISVWSSVSASIASRKSQRREVSLVDSFVTTEDCRRCHEELQRQSLSAREERKTDMNRLYTSLHDLSVQVAAHGAKLDIFSQRITLLDLKLDRFTSSGQSQE